ncbi:MAG: hypothetical protein IJ220_05685 [Clostridia bacterium]|nr:hypothetical protein [Clostridia bacterium]
MGKEILIITVLIFYLKVTKHAITIYRETTGLFKMSKYSLLISAVLNIILSIFLGKRWGLFGILLATLVARMLSDVWYEPYMLYKNIFEKDVKKYYIEQIRYAILTLMIVFLMYPFMNLINISNLFINLIVKFLICCLIPNVIYILIFGKSDEFKYLLNKIKDIFLKMRKAI